MAPVTRPYVVHDTPAAVSNFYLRQELLSRQSGMLPRPPVGIETGALKGQEVHASREFPVLSFQFSVAAEQ